VLTVRAEREHYRCPADDLFTRHADVVNRLCTDGRALLRTLLGGLIWCSRLAGGGRRHVNFFIKYLLVDTCGKLI